MKTQQFGTLVVGMCFLIEVFLLSIGLIDPHYFDSILYLFGLLVPLVIVILFYRLQVTVSSKEINLLFGVGLIRKTIKISDIVGVAPVQTPQWVGWGIRVHPSYTIYNIQGTKAIELTLRDVKRKIRIGSDRPDIVVEYINEAINVS